MTIINKTLDRSMYIFVREQNLNMSINHELNTAHVSNYKHGGCYIFHVVSTNISSVFNITGFKLPELILEVCH
jgi:hypothetical protein